MAFINIRESDRGKIHDIAKSYNEQNQQKKQREVEIMTKYLYMNGDNIDHEAYGFKTGADRFRILGVMRAWYMFRGMTPEEILSDSPAAASRREELMQEFHNNFSRHPDDTEESLRERRLHSLANMQDMVGRMKPVIPETTTEITADSFQQYMDLANLQSDMAINISDEYFNGEYKGNYAQYSGTTDTKTLHDENLYSAVHSSYRTIAASLCDIFATSAFEHNLPLNEASAYFDNYQSMQGNRVETKDQETGRVIYSNLGGATERLRKSLQRIHNFEQLSHEYNIDQLRNTSVRDISKEAKSAVATSLMSAQDPQSYESYNDIFVNEYVPDASRKDIPVNSPDTVGYFFMNYNSDTRLMSEILGVDEADFSVDDALNNIYINGRNLRENMMDYDREFMGRFDRIRDNTEISKDDINYRNTINAFNSRAADILKYSLSAESPNVVTVLGPDASNPSKKSFHPVYPPFGAYAEVQNITPAQAQADYDAKRIMIANEVSALNSVYDSVREPVLNSEIDVNDTQKNIDLLAKLTGVRPGYIEDVDTFKATLTPILNIISINGDSLSHIMELYNAETSKDYLKSCVEQIKLGLDKYGVDITDGDRKGKVYSENVDTNAIYHDDFIDASRNANADEIRAAFIDNFNQKDGKITISAEDEDELLNDILKNAYADALPDDDEITDDDTFALVASDRIFIRNTDFHSTLLNMEGHDAEYYGDPDSLEDENAESGKVYEAAIDMMKEALHSGNLFTIQEGRLVPVLPEANERNIDHIMNLTENAMITANERNTAFAAIPEADKDESMLAFNDNDFRYAKNKYTNAKYDEYLANRAEVKNALAYIKKNESTYIKTPEVAENLPMHYISQLTGLPVADNIEITDAINILNNIRINGKALYANAEETMNKIAAKHNIALEEGQKAGDVLAAKDADFKKTVVNELMSEARDRINRAANIKSIDVVEVIYTDSAAHKRGTKRVIPQNSDVLKNPDSANTFLRKQEEIYNIRNSRNVRVFDHKPNGRDLSNGELIEKLLGESINPHKPGEPDYRPDFDFDALDPALRSQLLGKIYINGRNIRSCLGENTPFNTQNVCARIREALSSESADFITVMNENSLEPAPVAIVTEESLKASLNFARDNDFESNSLARSKVDKSVNYVKNFRNEIYKAVKELRSGSRDPKSVGATADMIYADFYANVTKEYTATDNVQDYQEKCNSFARNTILQGVVQAHGGRPGSDASLIALYMISKGYSFEDVIDQSAEKKRLRAEIGKEYYDIFSLPQIDGKNVDINSPEASRKFEEQAMPALMNMAEAYSHIKLPYVDFSDPESIRKNGFAVEFITQMGMDFAQANNPRIQKLISATTPRLVRNIFEGRMKYVFNPKTEGADEKESQYLKGLPDIDTKNINAIKAQAVVDTLGNDFLREMSNAEIGALSKNCLSDIDTQMSSNRWLTENELRSGGMSDVLKGDFSKISNKFASLNKMDEKLQALKDDVANAVNMDSNKVFENKINDFISQPVTDSSITLRYSDLGNTSPVSIISKLTYAPLTENDTELNRKVFDKAFDLLYINGVSAKQAYGLDENSTFEDYMNASKEIKDIMEDTFIKGTGSTFVMVKNTEDNKLLAVKVPATTLSKPEKAEKWGFWERRHHSREEIAENEAAVKRYEEYVTVSEILNKKSKDATDFTKEINSNLAAERQRQEAAQRNERQAQNNAPAQPAAQENRQGVRVLNLTEATNMRNNGNSNSNENSNSVQQVTPFLPRENEAQPEVENAMTN